MRFKTHTFWPIVGVTKSLDSESFDVVNRTSPAAALVTGNMNRFCSPPERGAGYHTLSRQSSQGPCSIVYRPSDWTVSRNSLSNHKIQKSSTPLNYAKSGDLHDTLSLSPWWLHPPSTLPSCLVLFHVEQWLRSTHF